MDLTNQQCRTEWVTYDRTNLTQRHPRDVPELTCKIYLVLSIVLCPDRDSIHVDLVDSMSLHKIDDHGPTHNFKARHSLET